MHARAITQTRLPTGHSSPTSCRCLPVVPAPLARTTSQARLLIPGRIWPSKLLRPKSETRLAVRHYTDQSLIRCRQKYAEFVLDLFKCNLVRLAKARPSTLGLFFVAKADKLRLIFDTRKINQEFVAPEYSQLPTTGAWDNLLLQEG